MRHLLSLTCALAAVACQPKPSPKAPSAAKAAVVDATPVALVDAVGDSAPLTVTVAPARWAALHAGLMRRASGLPAPARAALERVARPEAAAGLALGLPPLTGAPGLDPQRPWVFALFEPPASGPVGATTLLLPPLADGFPGFRHRAALPATDAEALAQALARHLAGAGFEPRGAVPGRAHSHRLQRDRRWCALWPAGDHVYVEWVSHVALRREAKGDLTPLGPVGRPARGAALMAARRPAALSVRFEGRHLRAAYTAHGHLQAVQALASVAGQDIAVLLGRAAVSLLAKAEALMADAGADLNAHAVTLDAAGDGLRLVWSAEATDTGHAALAAGARQAAAPLTVKGAPVAQAATAFAWAAALAQAQVPAHLAQIGARPRALAYGFQECGVGCWWQLLLRAPLGSAAGALQVLGGLPGGLTQQDLPRGMQVVVPGPKQLAVAVELGAVDPGLIRKALAEIRPLRQAQLHVVPRGDRRAVLLGINVDPREIFDGAPGPKPGLSAARVDLGRLAASLPALPREAAAVAAALGTVTLRASLQPWGIQQVLDLGSRQPPPLPGPLQAKPAPARQVHGVRCPTCRDATPLPASARACLARAARGLGGLSALAHAEPAQRSRLAKRLISELEPDAACLDQVAAARPVAAGLRRILAAVQPPPTPRGAPGASPPP